MKRMRTVIVSGGVASISDAGSGPGDVVDAPWVVHQRRRWVLAWRDFREQIGIALEQSIDDLGHLVSHVSLVAWLTNK